MRESFHQNGYLCFDRDSWSNLKLDHKLLLSEEEIKSLHGINEYVSLGEVENTYMPLSRFLSLHYHATRSLNSVSDQFLGSDRKHRVPYVIGIAGSVAVGKSTTARLLEALLSNLSGAPKVALVTTDGYLYPNEVLEDREILKKKGFPESYDVKGLIGFLRELKAGTPNLSVPKYCHLRYDVVDETRQLAGVPDIVIVEGLNVLQGNSSASNHLFVSDFFDFSIYVDADEDSLRDWYIERFLHFRVTAFSDNNSYFHSFSNLSESEAIEVAGSLWDTINLPNLRENILPTRERARLVLKKSRDHRLDYICLRP